MKLLDFEIVKKLSKYFGFISYTLNRCIIDGNKHYSIVEKRKILAFKRYI